jgi:hypothetical protein
MKRGGNVAFPSSVYLISSRESQFALISDEVTQSF